LSTTYARGSSNSRSSPSPYSLRRSISWTGDCSRMAAQSGYGSRTPPALACSNRSKGSTSVVIASRLSSQLLSEHELLHLARCRAREVLDEAQVLGPFLATQAGAGEMGADDLEVDVCSRPAGQGPNERARMLTQPC